MKKKQSKRRTKRYIEVRDAPLRSAQERLNDYIRVNPDKTVKVVGYQLFQIGNNIERFILVEVE